MNIKERIKRISEYFKEMQIVNVDGIQTIYVVVNFPSNWRIDDEIENKYNTIVEKGNNANEYYFFTELENEEKVFDAIEYNVEKMKDAIERANLLKQKVNELKEIFQDENIPIQNLRTLTFNMQDNDIQNMVEDIVSENFKTDEKIIDFQNCSKTEIKDTAKNYTAFNKKDEKNKK
jgi:hypothetical protein